MKYSRYRYWLASTRSFAVCDTALYRAFEPMLSLRDSAMKMEMMHRIYDQLPPADFSKQVLAVSTEKLAVASLDDIGWSDLGDPRRLVRTLFEIGIENLWVAAESCNHCGVTLTAPDAVSRLQVSEPEKGKEVR